MTVKRALILGAGQDASYLADILLEKDYEVHLLHRRSSVDNLWRVRHCLDRIILHQGDLTDAGSIERAVREVVPDEVYNEADQDSVGWSYAGPAYSVQVTYGGVVNVLEAVRKIPRLSLRVFQPVSATMFGNQPPPQDERTPFDPQSPYACAKVAAYYLCRHYRQTYGMFVSTAILFNHDSLRRGEDYLLHKIRRGVLRVANGEAKTLAFGNLNLRVDIGCAREYMEAAWEIMQLPEPDDFALGTGKDYRIGELVRLAFRYAGIDPKKRIVPDRTGFKRPAPEPELIGDSSKAFKAFGWRAQRNASDVLMELMVEKLGKAAHRRIACI